MSLDRSSSRHSMEESNTSPGSPEPPPPLDEQLKIAKDLQSKYKRQYRNIKRDQADLAAYKMYELLDVEVEHYIQRSEVLCDDYTHNSEIIYDLMEKLNEGELNEALETIDGDIRLFSKLIGELMRLRTFRDAYSETVGMKALAVGLSGTETLSGPAEQEDIKFSWNN